MVYAADLFATGFSEGPLSQSAGRRYRSMILELGASRPESEIIERYLGRPCSSKALFEELSGRHVTMTGK